MTPRDPSEVAVGLLAPGTSLADLYLAGSEGNDEVLASYSAGPPATVTFTLAAGTFDESSAAESECAFSGNEATCSLGSTPLDSIVLAGMGGDDRLTATGFPEDVGVAVLGGEGADEATGGADSEDLLVGGADEQPDVLSALGRDDILIHEGGPDRLYGGDGNDLFLSTSVCEGAAIVGGDGPYRDSASWARADEAVAAYLATGVVGRPGQAGCGAEPNDSLAGIEDLEGSEFGDVPDRRRGRQPSLRSRGRRLLPGGCRRRHDPRQLRRQRRRDRLRRRPRHGDRRPAAVRRPRTGRMRDGVPGGAAGDFRHTELLRSPPEPEPEPQPPADTTPPRTRFTHHPPKVVLSGRRHRRVAFRFAANEPGSHFLCKIDRKPYRRCRSPRVFGVSVGRHAVRVRAVDAAGNVDPTPALFGFRVRLRSKRHGHHRHHRHVRPHHRRG